MTTYNNYPGALALADATAATGGGAGNTGGAAGRYFDAVTLSGTGAVTCETDYGTRVWRCNANGTSVARLDWTGHTAAAMAVEVEFEGAAAPTGSDNRVIGLHDGTSYVAYVNHLTDGKLRVFDAAGASKYTTTATVPTGAGWRVFLGAEKGTGTTDGEIHFAFYTASDGHGTTALEAYDSSVVNAGTANITAARFGKITTAAVAAYNIRYTRLSDSQYSAIGPYNTGSPPTVSYVEKYVRQFDFSGSTGTPALSLTTWTQASGPTVTPVIDGMVGEFEDDPARTGDVVLNYTITDGGALTTSGQVTAGPPQRRVGPLIKLSGSLV